MIKIFIVDHHRMFIDGLIALLKPFREFEIVGFTDNGKEAADWLQKNEADLLILDIVMPKMDGVKLVKTLRSQNAALKILILSGYDEIKIIKDLFRHGINGYLEKTHNFAQLYNALECIQGGEVYMDPTIKEKLLNSFCEKPQKPSRISEALVSSLTSRERDVMNLICEGCSGKEIAEALYISQNTVETHRKHILQKLNLKSSLSLMKFAMENDTEKSPSN